MAGAVGVTDSEFSDIMDKVTTNLNKVQTSAEALADSVSGIWSWIPGFGHEVEQLMDRVWAVVKEVFDYIKEFILNPGWPPALWHAGDAWTDHVGAAANSLVG